MAHGFRGIYLNNLSRFREAVPELERAGASHRQFAAGLSLAYIDKELCRSFVGLAQWPAARRYCEQAREQFSRFNEAGLPQTELLMAEIELSENRIGEARQRLDALIGRKAAPAVLNEFEPFRLRAEVNRRAGDLAAALSDSQHYIERFRRWKDAVTTRQTLVLSAQFAADLLAARAEALQRTLHAERHAARADRLNLLVSVGALALVLIILCHMYYLGVRHRRHLMQGANTDPLTGLPNRRHILDCATALLADARGAGCSFSIALLDLDHFKVINDTYGHAAGDLVLKGVATAALAQLPAGMPMGRWGGEEFLIVFSGHGPQDCIGHLDQLRRRTRLIRPHPEAAEPVDFSAGVAGDDAPGLSLEQIIDRADKAFYRAKACGRGRTCLSRPGPSMAHG
jgi:diguanylate cyclase (GGDEF)-like protein